NGCLDSFLCYKIKASGFAPTTVHLVDAFEDATFAVSKAKHVCTPADVDGSGTLDSATHLASYAIKFASGTSAGPQSVQVHNSVGDLAVTTGKPELLLVPSAKDLNTTPPPPTASGNNVDHYKCYKIKVTPSTPKFPKGVQV